MKDISPRAYFWKFMVCYINMSDWSPKCCKSSIKRGGGEGAYLFETHLRVGAGFTCIEEGGVLGRGWLIQFSEGNGISSHKDLCRMQSGKAQVQEIGDHAAKDKK